MSPAPLLPETALVQITESHQDVSNDGTPPNPQEFENDDAQEEEEFFDDHDSAFSGSLIDCDTETLASYMTDYRYENGRRYHAFQDGAYWVRIVVV